MTTETGKAQIIKASDIAPAIRVELLSGPMDGTEIDLSKTVVTIGREKDQDVSIPMDTLLSRAHAEISFEDGEFWIEDMGSRNGTFIEEKRISARTPIGPLKVFRVGATELRITLLGK